MKTKIETPRANAAAEGAIKMLTACKNNGDYKNAVTSLVKCLLDTTKCIERELAEVTAHFNEKCGLSETHVDCLQKDMATIRKELRRCVDLLDGECVRPDGSNADTTNAHALLGDFAEPANDPDQRPGELPKV